MNLVQLLTPKNEDGSIDQRYSSITTKIVNSIGKEAANGLLNFYNKSFQLEIQHGGYALQLVISSFSVDPGLCRLRSVLLLSRGGSLSTVARDAFL